MTKTVSIENLNGHCQKVFDALSPKAFKNQQEINSSLQRSGHNMLASTELTKYLDRLTQEGFIEAGPSKLNGQRVPGWRAYKKIKAPNAPATKKLTPAQIIDKAMECIDEMRKTAEDLQVRIGSIEVYLIDLSDAVKKEDVKDEMRSELEVMEAKMKEIRAQFNL